MSSHDRAADEHSMMRDQLTRSTFYLVRANAPFAIRFRSPNLFRSLNNQYTTNRHKTKNATCHE